MCTINVTTSAGATVTCVMSPYSYSATASSGGAASFVVPKIGTWTITATKGSNSKSTTVSVTASGSTKSVTLTLTKYLYNNGTQTVAWTKTSSASFESSYMRLGQGSRVYTTSAVSLTDYSKLTIVYNAQIIGSTSSITAIAGYDSSVPGTGSLDSETTLTATASNKTTSINISSVTGNKYICIRTPSGDYFQVKEVYLE